MKNSSNLRSELLILLSDDYLENQIVAGNCVKMCFGLIKELLNEEITPLQISKLVEELILDCGCIPTFKNFNDFPEAVCIGVNKAILHGVPKTIPLQPNDVIHFDLGATYKGSIADSARTYVYKGETPKGISVVKDCLDKAIEQVKVGNRIGMIANAIYETASSNGFNVLEDYGGHGVGIKNNIGFYPHCAPFIANKDKKENGIRIVNNISLAIEPEIVEGSNVDVVDKQTIYSLAVGFHMEDTIFIKDDKVINITRGSHED
jgi:methionyl aminopeptidase